MLTLQTVRFKMSEYSNKIVLLIIFEEIFYQLKAKYVCTYYWYNYYNLIRLTK